MLERRVVTMTAKMYALTGRNPYVLAYFMLVGLACIALDIVSPDLQYVCGGLIP